MPPVPLTTVNAPSAISHAAAEEPSLLLTHCSSDVPSNSTMASDGALPGVVVTTRGSGSQTSVSSGFIFVCCAKTGSVNKHAAPAEIKSLLFILVFICIQLLV